LEGGDQGFNSGDRKHGRFGAGFDGEIGAGDGDIGDQSGKDFDLAVTDVARQAGDPRQEKCLAEEGMRGIGDGDLPFAFLRDQRGITLGEVFQSRGSPPGSSSISG
jgi:hypothetical protein